MSEADFNISLPIAPTLIGGKDFERIGEIFRSIDGSPDRASWLQIVNEYREWESSFAGRHTSTTNRKLQLYRLLRGHLAEERLKQSEELKDVILSDAPKVGDALPVLPNRPPMRIVRREITDRLGILLTFKGG